VSSGAHICSACGFSAPADARFCSQCGARVDGAVARGVHRRRLFGVLAPGPVFVLGLVLLAGGIVALFAGSTIAAIALLAFAAAAFVLFYGAAGRDPESAVSRRTFESGRRVRGWVVFVRESLQAWLAALRDVTRLSRESRSLRRERKRVVLALGEAAYREDEAITGALRLRLREIDEGLASRQRARAATVAKARRHVHEEHVAVQPTRTFAVKDLASGGREEG
jgi:hypothetical protein